jgi:hypothetical protein
MIIREAPGPDPFSLEAFNASKPNIYAQRASAKECDSQLSLLADAEKDIIDELLAKRIPGASDLSIMMIGTTIPKSKRPSANCVTRFSKLCAVATNETAETRLKQDISLAIAVGAVAEATTASGSYQVAAAKRFDHAAERITDPMIPDESRVALGAFLVDRASHAREFEALPENLK